MVHGTTIFNLELVQKIPVYFYSWSLFLYLAHCHTGFLKDFSSHKKIHGSEGSCLQLAALWTTIFLKKPGVDSPAAWQDMLHWGWTLASSNKQSIQVCVGHHSSLASSAEGVSVWRTLQSKMVFVLSLDVAVPFLILLNITHWNFGLVKTM